LLILNSAKIPQGRSEDSVQIQPKDIGLVDRAEFSHTIHIRYLFNRVGNEVFIQANVSTKAELSCDRCLDSFSQKIDESFDIILTTEHELSQDSEEDIYLYQGEQADIDVSDSFKDVLALAIPIKKLCGEKCKGLCPTCGANWNHETCNCDNQKIDPRWDALKNITFEE